MWGKPGADRLRSRLLVLTTRPWSGRRGRRTGERTPEMRSTASGGRSETDTFGRSISRLAKVEGHRVVEKGVDWEASWLPSGCSGLVHYVIARRETTGFELPHTFSIWARRCCRCSPPPKRPEDSSHLSLSATDGTLGSSPPENWSRFCSYSPRG